MAFVHPRSFASRSRTIGGPISRRPQRYSASQVRRQRVQAVAEVDTATFDSEVLQVWHPAAAHLYGCACFVWCSRDAMRGVIVTFCKADTNVTYLMF